MSADDYLEWYVEQQFVLDMEEGGWECLKADKLKRGWTDQILFGPGERTVFVEFKRYNAKPRQGEKLQDHYHKKFRNMGFEVHKVTGQDESLRLRDQLLGVVSNG